MSTMGLSIIVNGAYNIMLIYSFDSREECHGLKFYDRASVSHFEK